MLNHKRAENTEGSELKAKKKRTGTSCGSDGVVGFSKADYEREFSEVRGTPAEHGVSKSKERRMCFKKKSFTVSNFVD